MYDSKKIVEISLENLEKISGGKTAIFKEFADGIVQVVESCKSTMDETYNDATIGQNKVVNGVMSCFGSSYEEDGWKFKSENLFNFSPNGFKDKDSKYVFGKFLGLGMFVSAGKVLWDMFGISSILSAML